MRLNDKSVKLFHLSNQFSIIIHKGNLTSHANAISNTDRGHSFQILVQAFIL